MKNLLILTGIMLAVISHSYAQNDTMYVMKNGAVINKQSVNPADIDSIVFYTPQVTALTDADGNVYSTITIGTQVWMSENLKTSKFNDGTDIPLVTSNSEWGDLTTPAYCWYNNDEETYKNLYGAYYTWYAVNTGKLCPEGWHVPTKDEWTTLADYLGGTSVAGGKLKATGTEYWNSPNTDATNETGFSGLPGSWRTSTFSTLGTHGRWWSNSEYTSSSGHAYILYHDEAVFRRNNTNKRYGLSVRCVKD
ncbi:MAG: fibrobacter succinogenes major paralogous domain-containing protein [Bacteroidales bacterium]|nr:fibrobacter succinogenes major paralogous domain-containing protein [Bacteroidales bacterium]